MKKMTLTFDWIDNGRGKSVLADEREFAVKDEDEVKKDISRASTNISRFVAAFLELGAIVGVGLSGARRTSFTGTSSSCPGQNS